MDIFAEVGKEMWGKGGESFQLLILGHVALAMGLGALVGLERELADRPAGLRTNMMVAGAACLLTILAPLLVQASSLELHEEFIRNDPLRIIDAVITGVSFIAAGTIIRHTEGKSVEGLTTAASLLFVASVGITVALSQIFLAVALTLLVLAVLIGVRWIERHLITSKPREESSR